MASSSDLVDPPTTPGRRGKPRRPDFFSHSQRTVFATAATVFVGGVFVVGAFAPVAFADVPCVGANACKGRGVVKTGNSFECTVLKPK